MASEFETQPPANMYRFTSFYFVIFLGDECCQENIVQCSEDVVKLFLWVPGVVGLRSRMQAEGTLMKHIIKPSEQVAAPDCMHMCFFLYRNSVIWSTSYFLLNVDKYFLEGFSEFRLIPSKTCCMQWTSANETNERRTPPSFLPRCTVCSVLFCWCVRCSFVLSRSRTSTRSQTRDRERNLRNTSAACFPRLALY